MLGAWGDGSTGGVGSRPGDAACTRGCGSAGEDAGTLCCEIAACPRLARVDAPMVDCGRLEGGGELSLSSLGIGLVRRLLRSLLPIVSIPWLVVIRGSAERSG